MERVIVTRLSVHEMVELIVPPLAQRLLDALTGEDPDVGRQRRQRSPTDRPVRSKRQRVAEGTRQTAR